MTVDAVVRNIGLAAYEPLNERRIPFESVRKFLEPVDFSLGEFSPELFRLICRALIQSAILIEIFDVGLGGKVSRRRINGFLTDGDSVMAHKRGIVSDPRLPLPPDDARVSRDILAWSAKGASCPRERAEPTGS